MSAPLRFIGFAIVAYVGLRSMSSALALEPIAGVPPSPLGAPMLDQSMPQPPAAYAPPGYAAPLPQAYLPMPYPMMPAMLPAPRQSQASAYPPPPYAEPPHREPPASYVDPVSASYGGSEALPLEQWPAIGTSGPFSVGAMQSTPSWGGGAEERGPIEARSNGRWSLDSWALLRPPAEGVYRIDDPAAGINPGLASAGSLGGSQAGMRLTFRPMSQVGVHLRASTALLPQGRKGQTMAGGEGALGVSWQPLASLPIRLMGERRQRLGPPLGGGRNAFAFLAEGGIHDREIGGGIQLDGYGQAGLVGLRSRDLFADGALAATYAFAPRLAVGGGFWGGVQPGLNRFDAGPRLSYQLSPRLRVHVDYRFRVTGNANPVSGPALTVAGGF